MVKEKTWTAKEWARWAVTGDPKERIPAPLRSLTQRIVTAIKGYNTEA